MYTLSQPIEAPLHLLMRHHRAANYHTRYQKSQLKQQALGKTTCKSRTSSSSEVVRAFSPGPKVPRRDPRAERAGRPRQESGSRAGGPRPSETHLEDPGPLRLPLAPPSRLSDLQSWGGGGSSFPFYNGGAVGSLSRPPVLNPEQSM